MNKMVLILIILCFPMIIRAQLANQSSLKVCPQYWREYKISNSSQTKCIKPFYEMVGRDEAQRRCQQMGIGFDLIEIHSMYENYVIINTLAERVFTLNELNDDLFNNFRPQIWIGAKRVPFGGIKDFQYRSGCGIKDFSFWHKGQPNDHFNNEDCVYIMIDPYFMGMWADYNCDIKMYYICQFVTDLRPPCNGTNYNLFGYNETNPAIHYINAQNEKTNISSDKHQNDSKRNTTYTTSKDRHHKRPIIFNPFELINKLLERFRKV